MDTVNIEKVEVSTFKEILVNGSVVDASGMTFREVIKEAKAKHPHADIIFPKVGEGDEAEANRFAFPEAWRYEEGEQGVVTLPRSCFVDVALAMNSPTQPKVKEFIKAEARKQYPVLFGLDRILFDKTGSLKGTVKKREVTA